MTPHEYAYYLLDNTSDVDTAIFCCTEVMNAANEETSEWYLAVIKVLQNEKINF